jgi:hypothetical protein
LGWSYRLFFSATASYFWCIYWYIGGIPVKETSAFCQLFYRRTKFLKGRRLGTRACHKDHIEARAPSVAVLSADFAESSLYPISVMGFAHFFGYGETKTARFRYRAVGVVVSEV